ncbi:MAG: glycosyltransferase involved in cell wall biosynthesis [Enterobacterales bacterium]|jgi:glycosyltransferase involved in cell wall biosynthesis
MNNSNLPLISVYMASKDRAELLKKAIDSVLTQDYDNFELVVVDDGSSDATPEVLASYVLKYCNVRYYRTENNLGIAASRNKAIEKSIGEFVTGLDDDDYFCSNRLSSLMAAYDDKYAFVCSSAIWDFGDHSKVADSKKMVFNLSNQLSYNYATTQVLVRRERILAIGGFDDNLVARLDYDAWTRLIIRYGSALRINVPSYVLSRIPGLKRLTNSEKNIIGHHQFLEKYRTLMSPKNLRNQAFRSMYAQNIPFGIIELMLQLWAGNMIAKLKYFIRVNFLRR